MRFILIFFLSCLSFLHLSCSLLGGGSDDGSGPPELPEGTTPSTEIITFDPSEEQALMSDDGVGAYLPENCLEANDGSDSGWENRRVRLGFAGFFFDAVELKGNFNLRSDLSGSGRVVENLDGLTVGWKAAKGFKVVAGKTKQPVTLDWSTSSKTLLFSTLAELWLLLSAT